MVYTKYPNSIDSSTELPVSTDLVTPVKSEVVNRHRDSIIAVESELGTKPSGTYTTVRARLDAIESGGGGGGGGSADGYAPTQRNLPVTVNGQTIFSLGINPSLPSATELFVNGIKYAYGTDFSVTGATVTWTGPITLLTTDVVDVIFFRSGTGAPVQVTIPVTVNGQTIFNLGAVPVLPYATEFFVNGVKNGFGTDFTLSGSTITYTGAPALVTTDVIDVTYIIASGSSGGSGGAGHQTWGQTLALGNVSGSNDVILSTGYLLRGETDVGIAAAPGATGSDVNVYGGLGTAGAGGNIQLASGDGSAGGGSFSGRGGSSNGWGGSAAIFGGNSSGAEGGPCGILGGFGSTDGGFIDIWAGAGNVDGGEITVLAGYGAGGDGGYVDIEGGNGSVNGGWASLWGGSGGTAGGGIDIEAGPGDIGGGPVFIYAGGADTGVGGSIDIGAGDVSISGIGGDVLIRAGASIEANAGNVSVIGGSAYSVGHPVSGGMVSITGGMATGAAIGGDVEIYGGQGVNNGGGSVTVSGGGANGGTGAGSVSILTQSAGSGTGSIYLTTAVVTGAPGGHIELQTGDSSAAGPGHIKLVTGNATGGGVTGANITIQSSNITHPASGLPAGSIYALAGNTAGAGVGGGAYIEGGDSSAGVGGIIEIRSGDGYTGGGLVHLWGGNDTNPSPGISSGGAAQVQGGDSINGIGGSVNIIPGTGGGGDGHVIIDGYTEINDDLAVTGKLYLDGLIDPPGMVFGEQPSVPGGLPEAGKITLWARSGDGYLVCTNSVGRNIVLDGSGTGGGGIGETPIQENLSSQMMSDDWTAFILSDTPSDDSTVELFIEGTKQEYGVDYIVSGTSLTYTGTVSLLTTDIVEVCYFVGSPSPGGGQTLSQTLALGNTTDGYNIVLSSYDSIQSDNPAWPVTVDAAEFYVTGAATIDGYTTINNDLAVTGKLYLDGLIDPTGIVLTSQSVAPSTPVAGKNTLWIRADEKLIHTDSIGVDREVSGLDSNPAVIDAALLPASAVYSWDNCLLWAADSQKSVVYKINPITSEVLKAIDLSAYNVDGYAQGISKLIIYDNKLFAIEKFRRSGFIIDLTTGDDAVVGWVHDDTASGFYCGCAGASGLWIGSNDNGGETSGINALYQYSISGAITAFNPLVPVPYTVSTSYFIDMSAGILDLCNSQNDPASGFIFAGTTSVTHGLCRIDVSDGSETNYIAGSRIKVFGTNRALSVNGDGNPPYDFIVFSTDGSSTLYLSRDSDLTDFGVTSSVYITLDSPPGVLGAIGYSVDVGIIVADTSVAKIYQVPFNDPMIQGGGGSSVSYVTNGIAADVSLGFVATYLTENTGVIEPYVGGSFGSTIPITYTFNGYCNIDGYNLSNVANPVGPQDVATKAYVDWNTVIYNTSIIGATTSIEVLVPDPTKRHKIRILTDTNTGGLAGIISLLPFPTDGDEIIVKDISGAASSYTITTDAGTKPTGDPRLIDNNPTKVIGIGVSAAMIGNGTSDYGSVHIVYNFENDCWYIIGMYYGYNAPM